MCEFENEWLEEKYRVMGLIGLVRVKGFDPDYFELRKMLEESGIDHGLPQVYKRGLGNRVQEIFEMACDGDTSKDIAEYLGAKTKTVTRFCNRQGIYLDKPIMLRDLDYEIREYADQGKNPSSISKEIDFSDSSIRKYMIANRIDWIDNFHKGHIITHNGYKMVKAPKGHKRADCKGYIREHRLAMEQHIGRMLNKDEIVHHKDGDKLNNSIENLEIMTLSDHAAHHANCGDTGWASYHSQ